MSSATFRTNHTARWLAGMMVCAAACCTQVAQARAQTDSLALPGAEEPPPLLAFITPLIMPVKIIQDESCLREYVKSDEFAEFRRTSGDRRAVDRIFREALHLSWGNRGEALLLSMLATFDHRIIGVRLMFGAVLWLPLTGEFPEDFNRRVSALPRILYPDTPPEGDRDKLQHFFGSAWLTIALGSDSTADTIGEFIEDGEELAIVGGVRDPRDLRANRDGQRFALALDNDLSVLPSSFIGVTSVVEHP